MYLKTQKNISKTENAGIKLKTLQNLTSVMVWQRMKSENMNVEHLYVSQTTKKSSDVSVFD